MIFLCPFMPESHPGPINEAWIFFFQNCKVASLEDNKIGDSRP